MKFFMHDISIKKIFNYQQYIKPTKIKKNIYRNLYGPRILFNFIFHRVLKSVIQNLDPFKNLSSNILFLFLSIVKSHGKLECTVKCT